MLLMKSVFICESRFLSIDADERKGGDGENEQTEEAEEQHNARFAHEITAEI